jgi:hypothetical protein
MKWYEEYRCGCVSELVNRKSDLCGYCPKHGDNRSHVYKEGNGVAVKARLA